MAITITVAELMVEMRLSQSPEELAIATRLHQLASDVVEKHLGAAFATTRESVVNESTILIAAYLYDKPTASAGDGFANAVRNSGAGRIMLPYVVHRAGYADAVEAANEAVGTVGNPVTGIDVTGEVLTVSFADGTTETHTLPSGGGGGGVDQVARDSAQAALAAANGKASQSDIDDALTTHSDRANVHHTPPSVPELTFDGITLPANPVPMRVAWGGDRQFNESEFLAGAVGDSSGLAQPPLPTGLSTGYVGIWIADSHTIIDVLRSVGGGAPETIFPALVPDTDRLILTVDGVHGFYWPSSHRHSFSGDVYSAEISGDHVASRPWVRGQIETHTARASAHHVKTAVPNINSAIQTHAQDPNAHHTPPTGGGDGEPTFTELATLTGDSNRRNFSASAADAAMLINAWNAGDYWGYEVAAEWAIAIDSGVLDFHSRDVFYTRPEIEGTYHSVHSGTFDDNTTGSPYYLRLEFDRTLDPPTVEVRFGKALPATTTVKIYGITGGSGDGGGGGGGTLDQTARNAASAAQSDIDTHELEPHNTDTVARAGVSTNASNLTAHEATPHGGGGGGTTDQTARDSAATAQAAADAAQTDVDSHETSAHNTDTTARASAATNASNLTTHEATPHGGGGGGGGATSTVLFESTSEAIGGSTALLTGDVVCPASGTVEVYFRVISGNRQGGVVSARIPAADLRTVVAALTTSFNQNDGNICQLGQGNNRGFGLAVQDATFFLMASSQAPGNFVGRILHWTE